MFNVVKKFKKSSLTLMLMFAVMMVSATSAFAASPAPLTFTGVNIGLPVNDVITTGVNFMAIFGDYTKLGLGILMAAIVIGFIFWLVGKAKKAAPGK